MVESGVQTTTIDPATNRGAEASGVSERIELKELSGPVTPIDAYLRACVQSVNLPTNLRDAIAYALLGPGKRLRPVLAWHSAAAVGAAPESSLPGAAAVELIHAFSLVHDDLPGIDNDDLRRGRPTLHRATSEAMAILAGDAMLNLAFELLADRLDNASLLRALVRELAAGTSAMIAGQVYDTLGGFEAGLSDQAKLERVHNNKTGALLKASCRMGALCGLSSLGRDLREDDPRLVAITRYADAIGLMFQIVDDILDVTQTAAHIGKATGKDADAGKLTYPGVLGLDRSRAEVRRLEAEAISSLQALGPAGEALRALARFMAVRTK